MLAAGQDEAAGCRAAGCWPAGHGCPWGTAPPAGGAITDLLLPDARQYGQGLLQRGFGSYLPGGGRRGLHVRPQVPPVPPADQQGVGQPPCSVPPGREEQEVRAGAGGPRRSQQSQPPEPFLEALAGHRHPRCGSEDWGHQRARADGLRPAHAPAPQRVPPLPAPPVRAAGPGGHRPQPPGVGLAGCLGDGELREAVSVGLPGGFNPVPHQILRGLAPAIASFPRAAAPPHPTAASARTARRPHQGRPHLLPARLQSRTPSPPLPKPWVGGSFSPPSSVPAHPGCPRKGGITLFPSPRPISSLTPSMSRLHLRGSRALTLAVSE
ncbi:phosphatidylethanolamine-binding protein 4 isoform X1 [Larus michahellis]|uniref:phosphatidylethanolamine-binding protein 4 isoform X1 n=1 Tax=Larus michahellis TaxID=119627 RepID=UPI003D9BDBEE